MKKKAPRITAQSLRARLSRAQADQVPEGYFNVHEWAKHFDLSESRSATLIRKAVEAGIMERIDLRVVSSNEKLASVSFYREVEK